MPIWLNQHETGKEHMELLGAPSLVFALKLLHREWILFASHVDSFTTTQQSLPLFGLQALLEVPNEAGNLYISYAY